MATLVPAFPPGCVVSLSFFFAFSASSVTVGGRGTEPVGNRVTVKALSESVSGRGDGHTWSLSALFCDILYFLSGL